MIIFGDNFISEKTIKVGQIVVRFCLCVRLLEMQEDIFSLCTRGHCSVQTEILLRENGNEDHIVLLFLFFFNCF